MHLKRLRHLVALADTRNFGRAAERCGLSQSAFSRSIQSAEEALGLQLFDRGTLEVVPTNAGAFVIERARRLLQEEHWLARDIGLLRGHAVGDLAFGVGPFSARLLVPPLLSAIRKRYPQVQVRVEINDGDNLSAHLRSEELDLCLVSMQDLVVAPDLLLTPVGQAQAAFYVRPHHPLLASGAPVTMTALLPYGIASSRQSQALLRALGRRMGLPEGQLLRPAVECNDLQLLVQMTMRTNTVLGCPALSIAAELASGQLAQLQVQDLVPMPIGLSLVTLAGRSLSPIARFAQDTLLQMLRQRSPQ